MDMKKLISDFPANILEAVEIANKVKLKLPLHEIKNVVICGMGGSGIGGSLVSKWLEEQLSVPVIVVKDYGIPVFVDRHSLVIGSSYSGNTEETLSAVELAIQKNAHVIGICSGGKLQEICYSTGFDWIQVPGGNPPRTALAFSLVQLLKIFYEMGLLAEDHLPQMLRAHELIVRENARIHIEATELAEHLNGKIPVLYAETPFEPALVRARQQFNENSKFLCWHHTIPEMNHNELVGWGGGDDRFAVVFFENNDMHPSNALRTKISKERICAKTAQVRSIPLLGNGIIEQSIYMINLVDWASYYLAEMNNTDAIDIEVIDYLKSELGKFNG